jgi:AcrR family transcriptional regulator
MGRPSVPLITRSSAILATLGILERDGLESFSMRRLATDMGVNQASLYYHFPGGRADILTAAARATLAEIQLPEPSDDWVEWMGLVSVEYRRLLVARPFLIDIMVGGYRPRTGVVGLVEVHLREAGVPSEYHQAILDAHESMVVGSALVSIGRGRGGSSATKRTKAAIARAQAIDEHLLRLSSRAFLEFVVNDPSAVIVEDDRARTTAARRR